MPRFLIVPPMPVASWPLEVGQGDDDIGIHQCAADAGVLYILAVNRNGDIVRALQAVGNDDVAARCVGA